MKDAYNKDLNLGDVVVYLRKRSYSGSSYPKLGVIIKLTKAQATIQPLKECKDSYIIDEPSETKSTPFEKLIKVGKGSGLE